MLHRRSPCSLPPTLIEPLESRRLYSVTGARLAIWADPGVVDPNSLPPEEVAELEAGTGDASGETIPGDEGFVVDAIFDPTIFYMVPFSEETGEVPADDSELVDPAVCYMAPPEVADGEVTTLEVGADDVLIDPAICYMGPPTGGEGGEIRFATTDAETGEVFEFDPTVVRGGGIAIDKVLEEEPIDDSIFYVTGGGDPFVPSEEEGVFVIDPLPIDDTLIDPIPVEFVTLDGEEVLYTMTGSEEPAVVEEPLVLEATVLEEPVAEVVVLTTAPEVTVPEVEPVQADPTPAAFQTVQVKASAVAWASTGGSLVGQILGDKSDDEDALA